jgi:hypothetical protein
MALAATSKDGSTPLNPMTFGYMDLFVELSIKYLRDAYINDSMRERLRYQRATGRSFLENLNYLPV